MTTLLIKDEELSAGLIRERRQRGLDLYDEVWEGMYVMPSMPNLDHQKLVRQLCTLFAELVEPTGLGDVYPGANVSDRHDWKENYRIPDVVVTLKDGRAKLCDTYIYLGPAFLVEVESPGDDTEDKVPFYSKIGVRELLIIHRDKRTLRLLRHDGSDLVEVKPETFEGKQWLRSEVLPLAFRRAGSKGNVRTEIRRTDGERGSWTM